MQMFNYLHARIQIKDKKIHAFCIEPLAWPWFLNKLKLFFLFKIKLKMHFSDFRSFLFTMYWEAEDTVLFLYHLFMATLKSPWRIKKSCTMPINLYIILTHLFSTYIKDQNWKFSPFYRTFFSTLYNFFSSLTKCLWFRELLKQTKL